MFRADVVRAVDKVFNRDYRRFSCKKIVQIAHDSCCETRGEACPWKQKMDGYIPREEIPAALIEARRQWGASGWCEYLFSEYGPEAYVLTWLYEELGIYATEKDLSPDFCLNRGVRTWGDRIERSRGHLFSIRKLSWAQRTLDEIGLILLIPAQDKGPPYRAHGMRRVLPVPEPPPLRTPITIPTLHNVIRLDPTLRNVIRPENPSPANDPSGDDWHTYPHSAEEVLRLCGGSLDRLEIWEKGAIEHSEKAHFDPKVVEGVFLKARKMITSSDSETDARLTE